MIQFDDSLTPNDLVPAIEEMWEHSAIKIRSIADNYDRAQGSPVFTVKGKYTTRGWTEWTQGFEYGSAILQYHATGEDHFLDWGREQTREKMAPHLTHMGVHDHGFNNVSTYGSLLRLMNEGRIPENAGERDFYELALKLSGAVQARRWTRTASGGGYIYSFNGPHSLFADTIRSLRSLSVAHQLGHVLQEEGDVRINLLERLIQHARTTAEYIVFYGDGRDSFDTPATRGRTVHECIFNLNDGQFRCPSSQQGYSPFTTWTRGLAWVICGTAEQLEFLKTVDDSELDPLGGRSEIEGFLLKAARATCDFYIEHTPTDGVPYWDTGAPGLVHLGDYLDEPANPFNDHEPVDSSAAAIGAQGLIRLGELLGEARYTQAGLTTLRTLLGAPYLSTDPEHQGLLLHSIYHQPNGWDHVSEGSKIANGESSMWGDYHLRELALTVQRLAADTPLYFYLSQNA